MDIAVFFSSFFDTLKETQCLNFVNIVIYVYCKNTKYALETMVKLIYNKIFFIIAISTWT